MWALLLSLAFSLDPKGIQVDFDYKDNKLELITTDGSEASIESKQKSSDSSVLVRIMPQIIDGDELIIDVELKERHNGKTTLTKSQVITFDQVPAEVELTTKDGKKLNYKLTPKIL